jgi:outer membrane protein assembly factor BamD (BamD/ComL family)
MSSIAMRREIASLALLTLAGGASLPACASPTVVRKSETAQRKEVAGQGEYRWEPRAGWVRPTRGKWGAPAQIRAEAREAFDAGAHADALEGFLAYQALAPADDPAAAEIRLWIGECYFALGNYEQALERYREVYQKHKPEGEILTKAFQRVYEIAMAYLHKQAVCSFLGIAYNCPGHGIELLVGDDGLLTEFPNLPFADDALYEIANHYFVEKQYPEALPVYGRLVREYPQSKWRGPAEYLVALSTFKQVRGVNYDEKLILDAERKFRAYLENNPRGPQAEDAREKVRELMEILGEKNLSVAKFYLRESEPAAARIYLRIVLDRYSSTFAAREAREIQRQLEKT